MTDLVIRDVPEDIIAAVDARASRLRLSRNEYVRRMLARDAAVGAAVNTRDLALLAETFADLDDPDVMSRAWR
jgi:plasmid stability protein